MAGGRIYEGFVPGRYLIDAYGNGGFRFADMSHRGSILALPSGIMAWPATSAAGVTVSELAPVFAEGSEVELLLFGTGVDIVPVGASLRQRFRDLRIGLDVMQTGAAARTYNVLTAEGRKVAAALIAVG